MGSTHTGSSQESGAALLELSMVLPLLVVILFGIIESGWAFSQRLEVQHGTREAARLVAVDFGSDAEVAAEVCDRMNFTGDEGSTEITVSLPGGRDIGDAARIAVRASYESLTGMFDGVFGDAHFRSEVDIRLEQEPRDTLGTGVTQSCSV